MNIDENSMFSKIYHSNPTFPEDFQEYIPQSDQSMSIFSYISRNHPEITWANPNALANNVIYVLYVLSPNNPSSTTKSKLQFCILALATNTISEFLSKVICPMCKISESISIEHNKPRKIQFEGMPIYDFASNFDQKLGDLITELNSPITYTSRGGCIHHILAVAAYSVKAENTDFFPCVMKTVGSSPSLCSKCGVSACKFAFKPESGDIIQLLCQKCSSGYDQSRLISLEGTFF
ncbi:hypothetical protein TVAG_423270 [Trichomonas vaginalis G3]|uniref:Uncharacterized protein n=1 Tax=Trichomonas vaginalis (strain ATCC PRA-98 / G3) TaxID=412133 RepID=A2DTG5_TRIV3|nr:hypothetical protein TVAGG3_0593470 [Trichomonas vaginalis G3]EAY16274.1 hypothetical protein TVAG_423270 [Trichomonas vaginalis G3]KAI5523424.1 hypothetical protein TVAGG3_0593470 [Trichomonas vaginalis G3]|eukprot:XP_001328497.1 hypothetical protein [Trichomonas vaginalis G3]